MAGTRIGILTINNPRRGLWRDAECLLWALDQEPVRRNGYRPAEISLFAIPNYSNLERNPKNVRAAQVKVPCPYAVSPNTNIVDWFNNLDTVIIFEKFLPRFFELAHQNGVHVVYVPNIDWASYGGSTEIWASRVSGFDCEVWAKTKKVAAKLREIGVTCELVPWSIPDPVNRNRRVRQVNEITFLINAGMGGWHNRRGVDIALKAFGHAKMEVNDIRIVVKSIKPVSQYVPYELLQAPGVEVIEGMVSREDLTELHEHSDAVLYPSRWEGFGLSLLEALHAGVPVISSDGWPMNEIIEHGHNGLLAKARRVGTIRLAPHWECSPNSLAQEMIRFATNPALQRRLTCPDPSELKSRQFHFVLRVRELLLGETRPRVILFRPHSNPAWRRSEEYWADSLRLCGYKVDIANFESTRQEIDHLFSKPHDFSLVSKASKRFLLIFTKKQDSKHQCTDAYAAAGSKGRW
jgi:glycosyltransferase involved in cell wall biosynthesis